MWLFSSLLLVLLPSGVKNLLLLLSEMISGDDQQLGPLKEGNPVDIACQPSETGSLTIWFRVLDKAGMEFIASFSNGVRKDTESKSSLLFSDGKIKSHKLTLKSFSRERDSGLYGCSSLIRGKELSFGRLTRLFGGEFTRSGLEREASEPTRLFLSSETVEQKPTAARTTPSRQPVTTAPGCACDGAKNSSEGLRSASSRPNADDD